MGGGECFGDGVGRLSDDGDGGVLTKADSTGFILTCDTIAM